MELRQSQNEIVRDAERRIQRKRQQKAAPRVLWAKLGETPEQFLLRCAAEQNRGAHQILAAVPFDFKVAAGIRAVEFTPKLFDLLHPTINVRTRYMPHGRASGCSTGCGTAIVLRMMDGKIRVLCVREFMRSLRDSVHQLLSDIIAALGLDAYFDITDRSIVCTLTGAEVIFAGLGANVRQLKSLENINLCYIEEAESVSKESLEILTPTIRAPGSEIWISANPDSPEAPIMAYGDPKRPDTKSVHCTWRDNPWFPSVLAAERDYLARVDPDMHAHVWEGQCRLFSEAAVFAGKYSIEEFEPDPKAMLPGSITDKYARDTLWRLGRLKPENEPRPLWNGPLYGADWGFSIDPSVLVRCWIKDNCLYIEHEAWGLGVDIDRLPDMFDKVPDSRSHQIVADSARPETINYMRRNGFPKIIACDKWTNSPIDGVQYMRAFEKIIVHRRCVHVAEEMRLYSFKVEKLTKTVLPDLEDRNNHCVDALRYALQGAIKNRGKARITPLKL